MFIFEYTQSSDFVSQICGIGIGVRMSHSDQNQKATADLADDFFVDADLRTADALYDGAHEQQS